MINMEEKYWFSFYKINTTYFIFFKGWTYYIKINN